MAPLEWAASANHEWAHADKAEGLPTNCLMLPAQPGLAQPSMPTLTAPPMPWKPQMVAVPVHMVPYLLAGQAVPQQQPAAWTACSFPVPQLPVQQVAVQEDDACSEEDQDEERTERNVITDSARRRLRRKRAARRRSDAPHAGGQHSARSEATSSSASCVEQDGDALRLRGAMVRLSFEAQGCRLVQDTIQTADHHLVAELVAELHGHVRQAVASPHANYVLQAIITQMPISTSRFIVQELMGVGAKTARHRFGCRILCRLIEHAGSNADVAALLKELLLESEDLCRHTFGHFVMESLLEQLPQYRRYALDALCADLAASACHRCAAHVLEAALAHCSEQERRDLEERLMEREMLVVMAQHQHGHFSLRGLLRLPRREHEVRRVLAQSARQLEASKHGLRMLQELGAAASE